MNLADGRVLKLPGIDLLPVQSIALSEATKRGVEIANDGRVFGLVRVHHWCGNDPIREHIARIDVAELLEFVGDCDSATCTSHKTWSGPQGGSFSSAGWDVGEFGAFRFWRTLSADERRELAEDFASRQLP